MNMIKHDVSNNLDNHGDELNLKELFEVYGGVKA